MKTGLTPKKWHLSKRNIFKSEQEIFTYWNLSLQLEFGSSILNLHSVTQTAPFSGKSPWKLPKHFLKTKTMLFQSCWLPKLEMPICVAIIGNKRSALLKLAS